MKDINYWKENCKEDYLHTPINVLRYIAELETEIEKNKTCTHPMVNRADVYNSTDTYCMKCSEYV